MLASTAAARLPPPADENGPLAALERFLQPGDFVFGGEVARLRTLLGSCVAITLWHPQQRIGGMCHYLLPARIRMADAPLDGRYADEAIELFLAAIGRAGTRPDEYLVKLFGGASMFPALAERRRSADEGCAGCTPGSLDVHRRNVDAAYRLTRRVGFKVTAEHLGGVGHRSVIFDVRSGTVWVRQLPPPDARRRLAQAAAS